MRLDGYIVRRAIAADKAGVQKLFEADPEYFEIVEGAPPGTSEFQNLITELAPGKPTKISSSIAFSDQAAILLP